MENSIARVSDIKRKFEQLSVENGHSNNTQKGIIKRSNAFRSDKPLKPLDHLRGKNVYNINHLNNINTALIKTIGKNCKNTDYREINKDTTNSEKPIVKLKSVNLNRHTNKHIKPITSQKPNFVVTQIKKSSVKNINEGVLNLPLPPGPPPKKPPRTFQHVFQNDKNVNNKFSKSYHSPINKTSSVEATSPPKINELRSQFANNRSKTESQLVVKKKLPNALLKIDLFNCVSDQNKVIYDSPYFSKIKTVNTKKRNNMASKENDNAVQSTSNEQPSLHYLSTPIVQISNRNLDQQNANFLELDDNKNDSELAQKLLDEVFISNDNSDTESVSSSLTDYKNHCNISAEQLTAERKRRAMRVTSMRCPNTSSRTQHCNPIRPLLFDVLLLISLDSHLDLGKVPYIKEKYPENAVAPSFIENLCYPDTAMWPPPNYSHNNYTLIFTNTEGVRKFGYCRRLQPEGAPFCLPLTYCMVTENKAPSFYYKILAELENFHGYPKQEFRQFVQMLYSRYFPTPGESLILIRPNCKLVIKFPSDTRQEETDLIQFLRFITTPIFLKIFSTALLERKIIFIGSNVSKLSDCINGLEKALYPFNWQHTMVTILPNTMLDVTQAPTPYIIGVMSNFLHDINFNTIDDVLVVNIDKPEILRRVGDENSVLPPSLVSCLKKGLTIASTSTSNSNIIVLEAILRCFIELVGHYHNHIITSLENNRRVFRREAFIKAASSKRKSHEIQLFLEWFTETSMFHEFYESRLQRTHISGLFEQRCAEYIEEKVNEANKKSKTVGKSKHFGFDKLMDWATQN